MKFLKDFKLFESTSETDNLIANAVHDYLTVILFTEEDNFKEEGYSNLTIDDFSEDARIKSYEDLKSFIDKAGDLLNGISYQDVAHDLWYTRNGHGVGFWDRGYEKEIGDKLTELAKDMGEEWAYVGDDGLIHLSNQ